MIDLEAVVRRIDADARGRRPVVLVDGGSGSGKTTLADELIGRLGAHWQLVSLDDAYPGWSGLAAASRAVSRTMLRRDAPGYRSWDWRRSRPGPWRQLDPERPILIEGCGAITADAAARASTSIWLELDLAERRRRALARPADGHSFADYWDMWTEQEAEHWRSNRPRERATLVLDV